MEGKDSGGSKDESPAIGIDLGTTYSCVGVWRNGGVEIIVNRQGNRITPSYVAFTDTDRLVGDAARNQVASNPVNTIFDVKRLIGRRFSDTTLQSDMALWPFKVVPGKEERPMIVATYKGQEKHFAAEEISAMILTHMKEMAEDFLGCEVTNAVVTVPAYFTDSQRRATKDAGTIAGLNVLQVINEPTAAALAYTRDIMTGGSIGKRTVLVFDLGGGTFDVSLLEIENGIVEVKATAGDTHLGGEDFDNRMVRHFTREFQRKHKKDMSGNPYALRRLKTECEKAKRSLSFQMHTDIFIESLHEGVNFQAGISRAKFEDLNLDLFEKCLGPVEQCLSDAKMAKSGVGEVLLVGGSTRIPKVRELLQKFFDGKKPDTSLHADEVVASGAAVHAAMLGGNQEQKMRHIVLVDVVSLSLGVDNNDGSFCVVVPRNTPIPVVKEVTRVTVHDNQTSMRFKIFEGERVMTKDNIFLGEFNLLGLSPKLANQSKANLRFHIDGNGLLSLTAHDKVSVGNKALLTITNEIGRLTSNEIAGMLRDAALYKLEDQKMKKKIDAKHELDAFAYSVRNTLRDATVVSKLGYEEKTRAEAAALNAIEWLEEKDLSAEAFEFDNMRIELEKLWDPIRSKFNL